MNFVLVELAPRPPVVRLRCRILAIAPRVPNAAFAKEIVTTMKNVPQD